MKLLGFAIPGLVFLGYWLLGDAARWMKAFLFCAILLPPLPIALGDSGPHVAPIFALLGLIALIAGRARVPREYQRLCNLLSLFIAALLVSECFAAESVGVQVASLALLRIALFAIGPLLLMHMLCIRSSDAVRTARWLFRISVIAALFACADFYFQFPSPSGFSAQFVWLDTQILRRAQGLFYEASTLGNFCAFFLLFAIAACLCRKGERPMPVLELLFGALPLSMALVLSYSRASLLNLICGTGAFLILSRKLNKRTFAYALLAIGSAAAVLYVALPDYWNSYLLRLQASLIYFHSAPNAVLSGRLSNWSTLTGFALSHPASLLFGVGYKTLPYSNYIGASTIVDNTYLDLLIETGVFGLLAFAALNAEILRLSWRAAHGSSMQAFFAKLFFCFWLGELLQMFSGDLITYWRVLPVYFWTLGAGLQNRPSRVRKNELIAGKLEQF